MEYETAGDPMTGLKWTRKTTQKISQELARADIAVCPNTVGRLLKQMDFSLRVNHKKLCGVCNPDRDTQFRYLRSQRERFLQDGAPIISVDTKKKEMVGNFKNPGAAWHRNPVLVRDHDFRSDADGMAVPYGVYDLHANRGAVFVGVSHDTPEFAAACIGRWWRYEGRSRYPGACTLLILADNGGSNAPTCRAWKYYLQRRVCDVHRVFVTVCHYPPGASKWNPIEHRFFSEISKNWAGRPLDTYATILNYIRTTKTTTGLKAKAYFDKTPYSTGAKISDEQMRQLCVEPHDVLPKWNYTLRPH